MVSLLLFAQEENKIPRSPGLGLEENLQVRCSILSQTPFSRNENSRVLSFYSQLFVNGYPETLGIKSKYLGAILLRN